LDSRPKIAGLVDGWGSELRKDVQDETTMAKGDLTREERLQIMLTPEELAAVDDYRFKQRMPSRAAAVRDLLRLGLAAVGIEPAASRARSGDIGVLRRGEEDSAAKDKPKPRSR
jgi:hypothetical protein